MSYPLSRLMSAASASYGVFALVRPRHLGNAMTQNPVKQADYDPLALTYGVRDTTISALGLLGRSDRAVTAAMVLRVLSDATDAVVLSVRADDDTVRRRILAITLSWGALNAGALILDRRRIAG
jgi:hypothetical protein